MAIFKTKDGDIFNLDDFSRVIKSHVKNGRWVYEIVPKIYVNNGNATCPVYIDKEEYKELVDFLEKQVNRCNRVGWWSDREI